MTAMQTVFSERRSDLLISARETRAEGVVALTLADPAGYCARLRDSTRRGTYNIGGCPLPVRG